MPEIELNTEEFEKEQEASASAESTNEDTGTAEGSEPELILGKFKSQEALVEAYKNLESKLGGSGDQEDPAPAEESDDIPDGLEVSKEEEQEESTDDTPEGEDSGIDFEKYSKSITENGGDLTEDDYKELQEKHKLPPEIVKAYVDGLKAREQIATTQANTLRDGAFETVGGKENYAAMAQWMRNNLSPEQLQSYDQAVTSSNEFIVNSAVASMHSKFKEALGTSGQNMIQGRPATSGGLMAFKDIDELSAAQADERYKKDPAYRKEVEQRMSLGFQG